MAPNILVVEEWNFRVVCIFYCQIIEKLTWKFDIKITMFYWNKIRFEYKTFLIQVFLPKTFMYCLIIKKATCIINLYYFYEILVQCKFCLKNTIVFKNCK